MPGICLFCGDIHVHVHDCIGLLVCCVARQLVLVILLCEVLFVIQDHDHRVAETAVVGFPHDLYEEGTNIHIHVYVLHLCTFVMYVYKIILCV